MLKRLRRKLSGSDGSSFEAGDENGGGSPRRMKPKKSADEFFSMIQLVSKSGILRGEDANPFATRVPNEKGEAVLRELDRVSDIAAFHSVLEKKNPLHVLTAIKVKLGKEPALISRHIRGYLAEAHAEALNDADIVEHCRDILLNGTEKLDPLILSVLWTICSMMSTANHANLKRLTHNFGPHIFFGNETPQVQEYALMKTYNSILEVMVQYNGSIFPQSGGRDMSVGVCATGGATAHDDSMFSFDPTAYEDDEDVVEARPPPVPTRKVAYSSSKTVHHHRPPPRIPPNAPGSKARAKPKPPLPRSRPPPSDTAALRRKLERKQEELERLTENMNFEACIQVQEDIDALEQQIKAASMPATSIGRGTDRGNAQETSVDALRAQLDDAVNAMAFEEAARLQELIDAAEANQRSRQSREETTTERCTDTGVGMTSRSIRERIRALEDEISEASESYEYERAHELTEEVNELRKRLTQSENVAETSSSSESGDKGGEGGRGRGGGHRRNRSTTAVRRAARASARNVKSRGRRARYEDDSEEDDRLLFDESSSEDEDARWIDPNSRSDVDHLAAAFGDATTKKLPKKQQQRPKRPPASSKPPPKPRSTKPVIPKPVPSTRPRVSNKTLRAAPKETKSVRRAVPPPVPPFSPVTTTKKAKMKRPVAAVAASKPAVAVAAPPTRQRRRNPFGGGKGGGGGGKAGLLAGIQGFKKKKLRKTKTKEPPTAKERAKQKKAASVPKPGSMMAQMLAQRQRMLAGKGRVRVKKTKTKAKRPNNRATSSARRHAAPPARRRAGAPPIAAAPRRVVPKTTAPRRIIPSRKPHHNIASTPRAAPRQTPPPPVRSGGDGKDKAGGDPRFAKFSKMVRMHIPMPAVVSKMRSSGFSDAEIRAFRSGGAAPATSLSSSSSSTTAASRRPAGGLARSKMGGGLLAAIQKGKKLKKAKTKKPLSASDIAKKKKKASAPKPGSMMAQMLAMRQNILAKKGQKKRKKRRKKP